MVAPLFILPHIDHLLGTDNLQSGFKCKQIMVAPISILSHIVPYCSPLSLKFPRILSSSSSQLLLTLVKFRPQSWFCVCLIHQATLFLVRDMEGSCIKLLKISKELDIGGLKSCFNDFNCILWRVPWDAPGPTPLMWRSLTSSTGRTMTPAAWTSQWGWARKGALEVTLSVCLYQWWFLHSIFKLSSNKSSQFKVVLKQEHSNIKEQAEL